MAAALLWPRGPRGVRGEPPRNLLLITLDTLRADALGAYGRPGGVTPWLDRLAASGIRFEEAHAHNVVTLPSHANILSGQLPPDHGVRDNGGFRFPAERQTLATLLKARGFRTAAFVSAFPLDSRFGLDRGFDVYDDAFVGAGSRPVFLEQERPAAETVSRARRWLDAGGPPFFLWVHLYEPHFPYDPPEPFASRFPGEPYLGEVAAADAALAPLLGPILTGADGGRTLVVATSDHGESLGEHGEATHGIFAYEATLRVPLLLHQPRLLAPRVVSTPARHVDLLPTILDALALPAPVGLAGRSLLPLAAGAAASPTTTYFEALSAQFNRGWAPLRGVLREGAKYVDLPLPELYDLGTDPREERNLADLQPRRVEEMRGLLQPFRDIDAGLRRTAESAETRERLRSLGYLGSAAGPARSRYGEEDDPKGLIPLDTMLQEVVGLYTAGRLPGALARCRELVARRPGMAVSLLALAHLEQQSGNLDAGVSALRRALALQPDDATTATLLAGYLARAGREREAVDLLEPYARREKPDVELLATHGLALAKLGRGPEALAALARAREQDPSNAMLLVEAGTVHLMGGDREGARQAFEAALRVNPGVARAHSSLGVLEAEDGRPAQAVAHWRKAVAADPRECEKLLALGLALGREGRADAARPYLEFFLAAAPPGLYGSEIVRVEAMLSGTR